MSNGGILGSANLSGKVTASGVWKLEDAYIGVRRNQWPNSAAAPVIEYVVLAGGGGAGSGSYPGGRRWRRLTC